MVNVIVFGKLKDITGSGTLQVSDVNDTNALVQEMNRMFPALAEATYLIAVEKEIINENTSLKNNYTVALLPPYSGG